MDKILINMAQDKCNRGLIVLIYLMLMPDSPKHEDFINKHLKSNVLLEKWRPDIKDL